MTVTVDIPSCCPSSEWWGIVVCLLVEPLMTSADPKKKEARAFGTKKACAIGVSVLIVEVLKLGTDMALLLVRV